MTTYIILMGVWASLNGIPPAWVAVIGSVVGGVGLKVVEKWLIRHQEHRSDKQDYREEIKELHERLDKTEAEVDDWRTKYYDLRDELSQLRAELAKAVADQKKDL